MDKLTTSGAPVTVLALQVTPDEMSAMALLEQRCNEMHMFEGFADRRWSEGLAEILGLSVVLEMKRAMSAGVIVRIVVRRVGTPGKDLPRTLTFNLTDEPSQELLVKLCAAETQS
jgi:hypothetical protein